ncbi:MAG: AlkA N-terminal domain-containing protein [Pseudomonadota bacterium]
MTALAEDCTPYYEALTSRDPRFDGRFFVAVRTTGIYCRPICPAPNPKAQNCAYYRSAAEAERDGYRPCKRCRPETAPNSAAWNGTSASVRRALDLIAEGALNEGSVDALAGRLGLGERHLRRLFERHIGASPLEVAATQRLHLARQLLVQTRLPMTEVAIASGYASLRRFNAAFKATYGGPPSSLRPAKGRGASAATQAPITLMLGYQPPYDWEAMLGFLRSRAIPGLEACDEASYRRAFQVMGRPGSVRVTNDPKRRALLAQLEIDGVVSLLPIVARLRALFDLDMAPASCLETLSGDPHLAPLVATAPGLRVPGCWDPFELLVRAILGQQVTVAAARTLAGRLIARCGGAPGQFPAPDAVANANLDGIGMPGRRIETLQTLAKAVAEGRIDLDPGSNPERLEADLLATPGIGKWTVGYVRLRALKDPDAFPRADIALLRAAQGLGFAETHRELERAAERWRPWRATAVLHLWRSLSQGA